MHKHKSCLRKLKWQILRIFSYLLSVMPCNLCSKLRLAVESIIPLKVTESEHNKKLTQKSAFKIAKNSLGNRSTSSDIIHHFKFKILNRATQSWILGQQTDLKTMSCMSVRTTPMLWRKRLRTLNWNCVFFSPICASSAPYIEKLKWIWRKSQNQLARREIK